MKKHILCFSGIVLKFIVLFMVASCKKESNDCLGCPCTYTNYYLLENIKVSCYCRSKLLHDGDTCDASKFILKINLTGNKIIESALEDHHYPGCYEKAFFLNKLKSFQFDCTQVTVKPLNPDILQVNEPIGYSPLVFFVDTNQFYSDTIMSFFTQIELKDTQGMSYLARSVRIYIKF